MIEKLKIKIIYDDFSDKVNLNSEQREILDRLIRKDKIIKISMELGMSERKISYEIKRIKKLYQIYKSIEKTRIEALLS